MKTKKKKKNQSRFPFSTLIRTRKTMQMTIVMNYKVSLFYGLSSKEKNSNSWRARERERKGFISLYEKMSPGRLYQGIFNAISKIFRWHIIIDVIDRFVLISFLSLFFHDLLSYHDWWQGNFFKRKFLTVFFSSSSSLPHILRCDR